MLITAAQRSCHNQRGSVPDPKIMRTLALGALRCARVRVGGKLSRAETGGLELDLGKS